MEPTKLLFKHLPLILTALKFLQPKLICLYPAEKPPLPPGVLEKDAELYKEVRDKAAKQLAAITKPNLANSPSKLSPTTSHLVEQERCPAAIEFGKHEIQTWYSSPFPQEYAR